MVPTLITIPFSHYCEKARWALDRAGVKYTEEGHLPVLHMRATRRLGNRSVPILITSTGNITDSTDIVAWADAQRPGTWLPTEPKLRQEALALEERFDTELGPSTRRLGYSWVLPNTEVLRTVVHRGVPRWQSRLFTAARPLATVFLTQALKINDEGVARSRKKIEDVFYAVDERLADGRRFLVGDRLSVADLSFAALSAPVLMPPEQRFGMAEEVPRLSRAARQEIESWKARPCGRFALRVFSEYRG